MANQFVEIDFTAHHVGGNGRTPHPISGKSGCYVITHKPTGKFFIGASSNLLATMTTYRREFIDGTIKNKELAETKAKPEEIKFLVCVTDTEDEGKKLKYAILRKNAFNRNLCNHRRNAIGISQWRYGTMSADRKKREEYSKGRRGCIPVTVEGVRYPSKAEAARKLRISEKKLELILEAEKTQGRA